MEPTKQRASRGWARELALGAVLVSVLLPSLQAGWVWTAKTGWYNPARAVQSTPEELFEMAGKAFDSKAYSDAAHGYFLLVMTYPASGLVNQAYLRLLEAQFLGRKFDRALETIEQILARKPDEETIAHVIKRKYEIGAAYLTGTPRYFWGIPISAEGKAVEVLKGMVERFPYQPYSDDALYHIASHYLERKEYVKAQLIYDRLIRDYPQSEWAGIAEYQYGAVGLRLLKGVEYDFRPVKDAERRFERYLRLYPGGDKSKESRDGLKRINSMRAERLLGIARFYRRDKQPRAARHYLQKIIKDHPDAPAAAQARAWLKELVAP